MGQYLLTLGRLIRFLPRRFWLCPCQSNLPALAWYRHGKEPANFKPPLNDIQHGQPLQPLMSHFLLKFQFSSSTQAHGRTWSRSSRTQCLIFTLMKQFFWISTNENKCSVLTCGATKSQTLHIMFTREWYSEAWLCWHWLDLWGNFATNAWTGRQVANEECILFVSTGMGLSFEIQMRCE